VAQAAQNMTPKKTQVVERLTQQVVTRSGSSRCRILVMPILFGLLVNMASASALEDLLTSKRYEDFQSEAQQAAQTGDAEALFLLGKSYHLGLGIPSDIAQALNFYERARALGSARASHNLGVIAQKNQQTDRSIALYQEALDRGLKMPTLANLGWATAPLEPSAPAQLKDTIDHATKSADYFAQAYDIEPSPNYAFEASRQYQRALFFAQQLSDSGSHDIDVPPLRELAFVWLKKGTDVDHGPSWTNLGVQYRQEGHLREALDAFRRGAEKGDALAHWYLGTLMDHDDSGQQSTRQAFEHFEQAYRLGHKAAFKDALRLLMKELDAEFDLDKLEAGIKRLEALYGADEKGEFEKLAWYATPLQDRLRWGRYRQSQYRNLQHVPQWPINLVACGLGRGRPYGDMHNISWNAPWKLIAYQADGNGIDTGIQGSVTKGGCAMVDRPLPPEVRTLLSAGAVLTLQFQNCGLALVQLVGKSRIDLVFSPLDTPTVH
jgi:uncharacterized protein